MRRLLLLAALAACGRKGHRAVDAGARDAAVSVDAAVDPEWRALDGMPRARARWSVRVPGPASAEGRGPIVVEGAAIVAGDGIGVAAIDLATRAVRFQRPIGHGTLPVVVDGDLLAIGDCEDAVAKDVVGCYTVLDAHVEAVHGAGTIAAEVPLDGDMLAVDGRTVFYGNLRFELPDPPRGEVRAEEMRRRGPLARPPVPEVRLGDGDDRVDAWVKDDVLELYYAAPDVISDRVAVIDFVGALAAAGDRELRGFRKVDGAIQPVIVHVDGLAIDTVGAPLPGTLIAAAHGERGFAVAARLDDTHAYVAALTPEGTVAWASPLSQPSGLAMTDDAVVAFHDGATLAIFPLP